MRVAGDQMSKRCADRQLLGIHGEGRLRHNSNDVATRTTSMGLPTFPTSRLPPALIPVIVDHLDMREMVVLQRVNTEFRSMVNARCLLPRRILEVNIRGHMVIDETMIQDEPADSKLLVQAARIQIHCFDRSSLKLFSGNQLLFKQNLQRMGLEVPFAKFLEHLPRRYLAAGMVMVTIVDDPGYVDPLLPLSNTPSQRDVQLSDIGPFLLALAKCDALYLHLESFSQFRNWQANYHHQNADNVLRLKDERFLRCQQCRMRYGTRAPWNCAVCEKVWDGNLGRGWKCGSARMVACFELGRWDFDELAQYMDFTIRPKREHQPGIIHLMSMENRDDFYTFLNSYEKRLRTVHNGRLEFLDATREEAKILQVWIKDCMAVHYGPLSGYPEDSCIYYCQISVYGNYFLVAFLWEGLITVCIYDK
ncbi:unnamed protein product, partial [Mesorhabditis spiculigera]